MDPIQAAIEAIDSREPGENFTYSEVARQYNVHRVTLSRRHKGLQPPREVKNSSQQKLTPQQELELVRYIENLTKRGLPPTREMIQNFASHIAKERVSESWVTRFIHRHEIYLISQWTQPMDRTRHVADSEVKYTYYFELLHSKIAQYNVETRHIYNMDEKGFMIGVINRAKRVFSRRMYEKKEVIHATQDRSREWITVIATVCADGSALPPGLIFGAASGAIQSSWVKDINPSKHEVFVTATPSGWSNDNVGIAWLKQVFDRYTKEKAGRSWRLLILDGHGSHVTMDFIEYCSHNRILLLVFPPHSTHTLQPLDVVMFRPLSNAYSQELTHHVQRSQGLVPMRKGDFFLLFWRAWVNSFKEKTILKSFEATGISPANADVILQRFKKQTPQREGDERDDHTNSWRESERLLRSAVKDNAGEAAQKLRLDFHHLHVENELLHHENEGLRDALITKKKHKKGRALALQESQEYYGGAVLWSPRKVKDARVREHRRKKDEMEEKLQKSKLKELRESAKLLKKREAEERRVAREEAKVVREKEKAEKQAEREHQKQQRNAEKAIQLSQRGKRKASQAVSSKEKRQKRVGDAAGSIQVPPAPSPPPPRVTSRGRNVKLPSKFK
ncbi:hypothetical protein HBI56_220310 [Parastagonospora nodorum]|nr:hypothetical protein HBI10_232200 [Parastagonospora nodorum]KAH4009277.1 hypothetical protein HBI13_223000 [Parastagonospora nodorum]KAH5057048.1 hypothetical protein HBI73_218510 [Parastagonospora nodorum]KAH5346135.1 hypothetical protein HBI49_213120 [Parastagonospora nodorum]KAH5668453.1 hypothetical protein HBI44_218010 [Parastagonospora nodorum]